MQGKTTVKVVAGKTRDTAGILKHGFLQVVTAKIKKLKKPWKTAGQIKLR